MTRGILSAIVVLLFVAQGYARAALITYRSAAESGQALLCRPAGNGPFAAVVYNHGLIVDLEGYHEAGRRGYDLDGICRALAEAGWLAFAPIRKSGMGNLPGHATEIAAAIDYVKTLPDVDSRRIALMGFSRGGLLTLMVAVQRQDLKAVLILAPAPGRGHFVQSVQGVSSLKAPVLLLVEASDSFVILKDFEMLEQALQKHGKVLRAIRYRRGGGHRLFWEVGYYWKDVRSFLREKLGRTVGPK